MNNEILFFKIIKNKYLFLKILSFLNTQKNNNDNNDQSLLSFKYDQIISVDYIIKNKWFKLLWYKVNRNDYLVFSKSSFLLIFQNVKKNKNGFYNSLFKNYYRHLNFKQCLIQCIKAGCIEALNVILSNGCNCGIMSIQDKEDIIIESINQGSLKIIKIIIEIQQAQSISEKKQEQIEIQQQIIEEQQESNREYIKFALFWKNVLSFNSIESIKKRYKIINFIMSQSKDNEKMKDYLSSSPSIKNIFTICPYEYQFSIKNLIDSCYTLNLISKTVHSNNLTNQELEIIQSQFQGYLKLTIDNPLISNDINLNKLLKMYFNGNEKSNLKYLLIFQANGEDNSSSISSSIKSLNEYDCNNNNLFKIGLNSIMYGNCIIFKKFISNLIVNGIVNNKLLSNFQFQLNTIYKNTKYPKLLFKYCESPFEQFKFLQFLIQEIKIIKLLNIQLLLFNLIIEFDNLDYITFTFNSLISSGNDNGSNIKSIEIDNTYRFIQSTKVLSFIYDKINYFNYNFLSISIWFQFYKIDLLECYEQLIPLNEFIEFNNSLIYPNQWSNEIISDNIIKMSKYVVGKPNKYKFDSIVIDCWLQHSINGEFNLSDVQFIINNTTLEYNHFNSCYFKSPNEPIPKLNFLKLFIWSLNNRLSDLKVLDTNSNSGNTTTTTTTTTTTIDNNSYRCKLFKTHFNELLYLVNKIDYNEVSFSNNNSRFIWTRIGCLGDTNTLDKIILENNSSSGCSGRGGEILNLKSLFLECLKAAARFGQIIIFKWLFSNNCTTNNINFIIGTDEIISILNIIIQYDYLELFEYFYTNTISNSSITNTEIIRSFKKSDFNVFPTSKIYLKVISKNVNGIYSLFPFNLQRYSDNDNGNGNGNDNGNNDSNSINGINLN